MVQRGKYARGHAGPRTMEEYEQGYIAFCQKPSIRYVSRAIGRSEKVAKSYIEDGWSGQPSYRSRLAAQLEEQRQREEVSTRKSITEKMTEVRDMLIKGVQAIAYVEVNRYISLAEDLQSGRRKARDLDDIKLPNATEELLKLLKIYEVLQRLAGAGGLPEEMRKETALLNVTEIMGALSDDARGTMLEVIETQVGQIKEADDGASETE